MLNRNTRSDRRYSCDSYCDPARPKLYPCARVVALIAAALLVGGCVLDNDNNNDSYSDDYSNGYVYKTSIETRTALLGLGNEFGLGNDVQVAINSNGIAVVVNEGASSDNLRYRIGQVDGLTVDWIDPSKRINEEEGMNPSVAINDNNIVVEIHTTQRCALDWDIWNWNCQLWYHLARAEPGATSIEWGPSRHVRSDSNWGRFADITINNEGTVVEIHNSEFGPDIWYTVGRVEGNEITWGASREYPDNGWYPSIAIDDDGNVVEMHVNELQTTLWYRTGKLNGLKIDWNTSRKHDSGTEPDIAMATVNEKLMVIEVHESEVFHDIYTNQGYVNGSNIEWLHGSGQWYDGGLALFERAAYEPSVAMSENFVLHAFDKNNIFGDDILYALSLLTDRTHWMEFQSGLMDKTLWEIAIPGSHDAGTYDLNIGGFPESVPAGCADSPWLLSEYGSALVEFFAETQTYSLKRQLNAGFRYFDLRVFRNELNNQFYSYHDLIGPTGGYPELLQDVRDYMETVEREVAILKISHFCNSKFKIVNGIPISIEASYLDANHAEFIDLVKAYLQPYLLKSPAIESAGDVFRTPLRELVADGPKVIVLYDDEYIDSYPEAGFYRFYDQGAVDECPPGTDCSYIYDEYTGTAVYEDMRDDQKAKLLQHFGLPDHLFLLSWTLTAPKDHEDWPEFLLNYQSLRDLTRTANRELVDDMSEFIETFGIEPNIIYVDHVQDSRAADLAIVLNRD